MLPKYPISLIQDINPTQSYSTEFMSSTPNSTWIDNLSMNPIEFDNFNPFVASFLVIIVSEIGDKTFIINAILAMTHSRVLVFMGAMFSIFIMTLIGALFGYTARMIPDYITLIISSLLFLIFGLRMIYEAYHMKASDSATEYAHVEQEINDKQKSDVSMMERGCWSQTKTLLNNKYISILTQSASLTFVAEWGDRSQIATILLATRHDTTSVIVGATAGHAVCTCMAVIAGGIIAKKLSIRFVTFCGGIVFIVFFLLSTPNMYKILIV